MKNYFVFYKHWIEHTMNIFELNSLTKKNDKEDFLFMSRNLKYK